MFKKNSWIAALLLALSLTAFLFTGCVSPLKVEEDTETYEEYPLDKGYNAWAGQVYQKGWAIGGIKFLGKGDAVVIAKDLGYDVEMFQKATKLKIEMPDASYPRSGVDIIWGGEDDSGSDTGFGMWNQQPIAGGSGDLDSTFAKKDGNVLIIDLTKALKNYSAYKKAAKIKIVMQVNAPSYDNVEGLVQKAYLMIPTKEPPFVSIKKDGLALKEDTMYYTSPGFELEADIQPADATNQTVIWQIYGWSANKKGSVPQLSLPTIDLTDPDNDSKDPAVYAASSLGKYEAAQKLLFEKVRWLQEEYTIDDTVYPPKIGLKNVLNTLIAPAGEGSEGRVFLIATIKQGQKVGDTYSDYTTRLPLTIEKPLPFKYKLFAANGTTPLTPAEGSTIYYGAVDNGGVSGGKMVGVKANTSDTFYTGYTITLGGGYGNSHHYIKIDLSGMGAGNTKFSDYKQIKAKYTAGDGDSNLVGKTVRLRASTAVPERTYWAGPFLSTLKYVAADGDGKEVDLTFNLFKDDGDVYKDNADTPSVGGNMPNPQSYNGREVAFGNDYKDASVLYIWIVPWCTEMSGGKRTTFTITDLEFVHN